MMINFWISNDELVNGSYHAIILISIIYLKKKMFFFRNEKFIFVKDKKNHVFYHFIDCLCLN